MTYKYDVFISYSRKDYKDEATKAEIPGNPITAITEAFDKNNIFYWIDLEGIKSGQEFRDEIIDAIATSKVFLFVSSVNSNGSVWTKREVLEASDSGKYIIPFKIDNCEYDRSVKFELRPLDFIEYFSDKDGALEKLVRSVNSYKEIIAQREQKAQLESQKAEIQEKIKLLEADYRLSADRHEVALKEIQQLYEKLGIITRCCPICDKEVAISATFCERCGWQFPALPSSQADRKRLNIIKANWKLINSASSSKEEIKSLRNEIYDLNEALKKAESEKKNYEKTFSDLKKEIEQLIRAKEKALAESKEQKEQIALLTSQSKDIELRLTEKRADYDSTIKKMYEETEKLNSLVSTLKAQNEELTKKYEDLSEQYNAATKELDDLRAASNKSQKTKQNPLIAKLTNFDWVYTHIIPSSRKDRNNFLKTQIRLTDSVTKIDFQRLITIVGEYGVVLSDSFFEYCIYVSDIVNVVVYSAVSALEEDNGQKTKGTKTEQKETLEAKQMPHLLWKLFRDSYSTMRSSDGKYLREIDKEWVFDNIMPLCNYKGIVFLSDSCTAINFPKLISILKDHGIVLEKSDFDICNTVEDVVYTIVDISRGKLRLESK